MTRRGFAAGSWVLSARFLAWARGNGYEVAVNTIQEAREVYKAEGADTARYEALSDEELTAQRAKANNRIRRLTAEATRRESVTNEIESE